MAEEVARVDTLPGSQTEGNAHWHHMCAPGWKMKADCARKYEELIHKWEQTCKEEDFWKAVHAVQDSHSPGHDEYETWYGDRPGWGYWWAEPSWWIRNIPHGIQDISGYGIADAAGDTAELIKKWNAKCGCNR